MTKAAITSRSKNTEAPFTETQLLEIVNEKSKLAPQELVSELANKLTTISSKHKFIIQHTTIATNDDTSFNLNICTDFVASWEPSKDGCITVQLDLEKGVDEDLKPSYKETKKKDESGSINDYAAADKPEGTSEEVAVEGDKEDMDTTRAITREELSTKQSQTNSLLITIYWISI